MTGKAGMEAEGPKSYILISHKSKSTDNTRNWEQ